MTEVKEREMTLAEASKEVEQCKEALDDAISALVIANGSYDEAFEVWRKLLEESDPGRKA